MNKQLLQAVYQVSKKLDVVKKKMDTVAVSKTSNASMSASIESTMSKYFPIDGDERMLIINTKLKDKSFFNNVVSSKYFFS